MFDDLFNDIGISNIFGDLGLGSAGDTLNNAGNSFFSGLGESLFGNSDETKKGVLSGLVNVNPNIKVDMSILEKYIPIFIIALLVIIFLVIRK